MARLIKGAFSFFIDDDEEEREIAQKLWRDYRLLLPADLYRKYWNRCLLVLVLYNTAFLPLDLCFGARPPRALDYTVDGFFLADILLNLRTTYYVEDSAELILDWRLAGPPPHSRAVHAMAGRGRGGSVHARCGRGSDASSRAQPCGTCAPGLAST